MYTVTYHQLIQWCGNATEMTVNAALTQTTNTSCLLMKLLDADAFEQISFANC
jgi:hypothetical protein